MFISDSERVVCQGLEETRRGKDELVQSTCRFLSLDYEWQERIRAESIDQHLRISSMLPLARNIFRVPHEGSLDWTSVEFHH